MPVPFELDRLGLDPDAEVLRLFREHPGIETRGYRDGEFLVVEGQDAQEVFIVLKGAFVVEQAPTPPNRTASILASVEVSPDRFAIVGEMSLLGLHRRSASVRSVGMTHTLCLGLQHLEAVLMGYPGLTRLVCEQFSTRLRDTNRRLKDLQDKFALNPHQRMVEPGTLLFSRGEPATVLYQMMMGAVRLEGDGEPRVVTPDQLEQGFLEPAPFLRNRPQAFTAVAEEQCFLVGIPATHLSALVRSYPDLALRVLESL